MGIENERFVTVEERRHNFGNFFQTSRKSNNVFDPNSGIHLVGPMFELMACVDKERNTQDYDAYYPDSGVSYGPSICSFGLPYNDHNYALPTGLTPPSMAPHLMDLNVSSISATQYTVDNNSKESDFRHIQEISYTTSPITNTVLASGSPIKDQTTKLPSKREKNCKQGSENLMDSSTCKTLAKNMAEATEGLSEPKKTLFGFWHAKAASTGGTLVVQQRWKDQESLAAIRYTKPVTKMVDDMELRYDLEMKVTQVPDEICVSPSQLSGLDSESSEDESYQQRDSSNSLILMSPSWIRIRCICNFNVNHGKMIQCTKCRLSQHYACMETVYQNVNQECTTSQLSPEVYQCEQCFSHFVDPAVIEGIKADMQGRQLLKQKHQLATEGDSPKAIGTTVDDAQLLVNATNRARQLGLLTNSDHQQNVRQEIPTDGSAKLSNCTSRLPRHSNDDMDVNLRMPSPPRASKRKQDLTVASLTEANKLLAHSVSLSHSEKIGNPSDSLIERENLSNSYQTSGSATPVTTPSTTPLKSFPLAYHHHLQVFSAPSTPNKSSNLPIQSDITYSTSRASDTTSESSPSLSTEQGLVSHRKKIRSALFTDRRNSPKGTTEAHPSTLGLAWAKNYREAESSIFSMTLLERINERILSGRERNLRIPPACLDRNPLCHVVLFDHDDKGLESSVRLTIGEVVAEMRGCLKLLEEYEHYVDPASEYHRYVFLYHGFGDRGIAIDTSQYGNDARFIRRSCMPNCKLEHSIACGRLHILIKATHDMVPGEEITLPFDIDYRSCSYPLECACARSRCPVLKWKKKLIRNKVVPNLNIGKYIESRLKDLSKPLSDECSRRFVTSDNSSSGTNSPVTKGDGLSSITGRQSFMSASALVSPQRFTPPSRQKHNLLPSGVNSPENMDFKSPNRQIFLSDSVHLSGKPIAKVKNKSNERDSMQMTCLSNLSSQISLSRESKKRLTRSIGSNKRMKTKTDADCDSSGFESIITTRRQAAACCAPGPPDSN